MQTSSEYDNTGNYVTETNEQGSTTKYAYDASSNKTAVTDGNGNGTITPMIRTEMYCQ